MVVLAGLLLLAGPATAHDIPRRIHVHGYMKPEGQTLHALFRVPTILLLNVDLPKRGPGYLDLGRIDPALERATGALARDVRLFEDGRPLAYRSGTWRISLPSDRSFESYGEALTHIHGPALPPDTQLFWNQGFFDVHVEYPIRSDRSDFALESTLAPEVRDRLTFLVRFVTPDGAVRLYELAGDAGRVHLDPRWYQAAWLFVRSGTAHILGGLDHLLFLLALVLPYRQLRGLLPVVTSFTVAHSVTLVASAYDLVPSGEWFPRLVETLIAASIVYMVIENVVGANLARRWTVTGAFGLIHGLGFSYGLQETFQLAGDHMLVSLASFNLGVEIGQVLLLAVGVPVLWALFRMPALARYGVVVISVMVGHTAWHWMVARGRTLTAVEWPDLGPETVVALARGVAVILIAAGAAWVVARRWPGRVRPARQAPEVPEPPMERALGVEALAATNGGNRPRVAGRSGG
jgi:hypothetical protein